MPKKLRSITSCLIFIFILATVILSLSGFQNKRIDNRVISSTESKEIEHLLTERSRTLQDIHFKGLDREQGLALLSNIESYPLLTEDLSLIGSYKDTDMDIVINMALLSIEKISNVKYGDTFSARIKWYMNGLSGNYTCEQTYTIRTTQYNNNRKLVSFTPE